MGQINVLTRVSTHIIYLYTSSCICKTYLDKILKLQKWTMRTVTNSHYRSHAAPLFLKHNVLNVNDSFRLNLGIFMYKHSQNHNYPTRNAQDHSINNNSKIFTDCAIRKVLDSGQCHVILYLFMLKWSWIDLSMSR